MYVLFGVFFGWAFLAITIVFLIFICGKYGKLAELVDEKKQGEDVEKIAELYKNAQAFVHNEKKAQTTLNTKIGTSEDDQKIEATYCGCCTNVTQITTSRHPSLPLLKKTMVKLKTAPSEPIHMNKMKDYYKNDLYISQAPTKDEFPRFIDAILQERIGIVVWLSKPNDNLQSYIPMKSGTKLTIGDHIVEYELSGKRDEYDFYFVHVISAVKMPVASLVRVIFVIAHSWTLTAVPKHMTRHCDVISLVQCFHDFTVENGFPGMLVHNTSGVNLSVGFSACYIGRQILLDKRKVNIVGICRYIRQHRHCAFTYEKTSHQQLQVIYMVLGSFSRNFAYEEAGQLTTTKDEKELFEKAKKIHPMPRDSVSAWGGQFSYH